MCVFLKFRNQRLERNRGGSNTIILTHPKKSQKIQRRRPKSNGRWRNKTITFKGSSTCGTKRPTNQPTVIKLTINMFHRAASTLLRTHAVRSTANVTPGVIGSVRNLNVHEHISMELFNKNGITTPKGIVAVTPEEAEVAYFAMGTRELFYCLVRVQISS